MAPALRQRALIVVVQAIQAAEEQRSGVQQGDELRERHVVPDGPVRAVRLRKGRVRQPSIDAVHARANAESTGPFLGLTYVKRLEQDWTSRHLLENGALTRARGFVRIRTIC